MNRLRVVVRCGVIESGVFHNRLDVVDRDATIYLEQGPFDEVFQLRRAQRTGAAEGEEMSPGFGGKSSTFVRS
jgi:hypothetical protein